MNYDGMLTISTGLSRKETDWKPKQITWGELCKQLSLTKRTAETEAEYAAMDKGARGEIKDVGGFVGGEIVGGNRKSGAVKSRQILSLDADFGTTDMWADYQMMFEWACLMHTTHSHTKDAPRYAALNVVRQLVHRRLAHGHASTDPVAQHNAVVRPLRFVNV